MARVLVIDDNEILAKAYESALIKNGFKTLKAYDGRDALAKIRNEKFELVITDIQMPRLSGIELIECMRRWELETQYKTPIIISSSFIDESVYKKFSTVGRIYFLPKPVLAKDLVAKVRSVLNLPGKKPTTLDVKVLNGIISGVTQTLKSMSEESLAVSTPGIKKTNEPSGDISGVVSILGESFRGSVSISFEEQSFLKLISKFLKIDFKAINEENKDSVVALLNTVFDAAKTELEKQSIDVTAAVPTIITGKNHCVDHKQTAPTVTIMFKGKEFGECRLEVCAAS